jgi:RNA-directed DNA polymerase
VQEGGDAMTGTDGQKPAAVPDHPGKRAGEVGPARPTAEPLIWTARMLATLETGVIGGKWYSLIDKLYPEATLRAAFKAVATNRGAAGVDHVSVEDYAENLETNLARLSAALRTGNYRPQAIRRPTSRSREARRSGRWARLAKVPTALPLE